MQRLLVWNGSSGQAAEHAQWLADISQNDAMQIIDLSREHKLTEAIAAACDSGCRTVIAAGGDGTVNAVVNSFISLDLERRPRMAILPLGTANDFAATLGIPDGVNQALKLLDTDHLVPVDVVKIHAEGFVRYYANIAAGGNSVRASELITDEIKAQWGAFAYLRGGLPLLVDLETYRITATCDSEVFGDIDCWAVLVANGRTNAGRIVVAPTASPVDGLLDVIIIQGGTVLNILDIVSQALLGNYLECEQVIHRQVRRLRLHSVPGMRFTIDGEVIDEEPVEFEALPGAISMYVGDEFWSEQRQVPAA